MMNLLFVTTMVMPAAAFAFSPMPTTNLARTKFVSSGLSTPQQAIRVSPLQAFGGGKAAAAPAAKASDKITYDEVRATIRAWCDGVVEIGKVFQEGGDYRAKAMQHIEESYAFSYDHEEGNVLLFKPTLASEHPFRSNFDEFVSYFVGDGKYSEDKGFAIKPWTSIRFDMHGVFITGASATCMGNYWFTTLEGDEVKVEYTFQMIRVAKPAGKIKFVLQHSSVPFSP